ncbi:hypothetical protein [Rheinheimera fenheensis]|uniref:hypothetical protein n=1 Tax=Rheinheimera fenheensis TaxID=3152295 RepID=UPI00325F1A18
MKTPNHHTAWHPETNILDTRLSGTVDTEFVRHWANGFVRCFNSAAVVGNFKLLLDLTGYEPIDIDAHKQMREVIPAFLLKHGMVPAFIKLFENTDYHVVSDPQAKCWAFANVHHDVSKMQNYQEKISCNYQQFFHSRIDAVSWLQSVGEN